MTLLMRDQEHERIGEERGEKRGEERGERIGEKIGQEIGQEIGQKIGEERMLALLERLLEDNRFSDIAKMAEDKQYRQDLYKEYHII